MSNSFTNQVIAQIELFGKTVQYEAKRSTSCPSTSTRRSPVSTSRRSASSLTELSDEQAAYLGIPAEGPYKPEHYRY